MRSPCTAMKSSPRSPQLEKAHMQQQRPNTAKNTLKKKKKKTSPWCQPIQELSTSWWGTLRPPPSHCVWNPFLKSHQGIQIFWAWAACSPCLVPCNKHCTFLHQKPVSVDRLCCTQESGSKFGSRVQLLQAIVPSLTAHLQIYFDM